MLDVKTLQDKNIVKSFLLSACKLTTFSLPEVHEKILVSRKGFSVQK